MDPKQSRECFVDGSNDRIVTNGLVGGEVRGGTPADELSLHRHRHHRPQQQQQQQQQQRHQQQQQQQQQRQRQRQK